MRIFQEIKSSIKSGLDITILRLVRSFNRFCAYLISEGNYHFPLSAREVGAFRKFRVAGKWLSLPEVTSPKKDSPDKNVETGHENRKSPVVYMFWAYGSFSRIELLCVKSFVDCGFEVHVFTYGQMDTPFDGVTIKDARVIIEEENIFTYKNGSYSAFSNVFRYALLKDRGGIWADTDVVCLIRPEDLPEFPFLVSETRPNTNLININSNLIFAPDVKRGDVIDLAFAVANSFDNDDMEWGETGPFLLSILSASYTRKSYHVMPPVYANGVPFEKCPEYLIEPGRKVPEQAAFLHLYNEVWRRSGIDKNGEFNSNSIIGKLMEQHQINVLVP